MHIVLIMIIASLAACSNTIKKVSVTEKVKTLLPTASVYVDTEVKHFIEKPVKKESELFNNILETNIDNLPNIMISNNKNTNLQEIEIVNYKEITFKMKLKNLLHRLGENPGTEELDGMTKQVNQVIKIFQTRKHKWYQKSLNRAQKYLPMIREVMSEKQMPEEIAYLAMVESGFIYSAGSHAGAVGLWQFMRGTAKDYGLRISRKVDQRRDPLLSTYAAREYLLDLVAIYGSDSLLLAMASYNAGEGRVQRALRKLENPFEERSFFHLQSVLPKETRLYVPQILAAALIAAEPEKYGFTAPSQKQYAYIMVNKRSPLKKLAGKLGISVKQLLKLNDDLSKKNKRTPITHYVLKVPAENSVNLLSYLGSKTRWWPGSEYQHINNQLMIAGLVPKVEEQPQPLDETAEIETVGGIKKTIRPQLEKPTTVKQSITKVVIAKLATNNSINKLTIKVSPKRQNIKPVKKPAGKYIRYKIQRGNTLKHIAKWFNTSVKKLKRWNPQYHSTKPRTGEYVLVYGLPKKQIKSTHKVRSGESLWTISGLYDVDLKQISQWNGLQKRVIYPNQKLLIYSYKKPKQTSQDRYKVIYQVKKNNHLAGIASIFNVSIRNIKHWNKLASGRIYQGQKLKLYLSKSKVKKHYRIKNGDTLGKIAKRLKYSQNQLAFVNGLTNKRRIIKGRRLVYYQ